MKQLDLATIAAVMQEMLGLALWPLLALAAAVPLGVLAVLLRDRGLRPARLIWAQAIGLPGGVAALLLLLWVTDSQIGDIGGPIDWFVVAGVVLAGAIGTALAAYAALGLLRRA